MSIKDSLDKAAAKNMFFCFHKQWLLIIMIFCVMLLCGHCPRTPLGCCAYGVSFRSRRNCYGPLFLNFLDPPLVVDEIQPNLKFVNPNPKN